jgi:hypothetical protein
MKLTVNTPFSSSFRRFARELGLTAILSALTAAMAASFAGSVAAAGQSPRHFSLIIFAPNDASAELSEQKAVVAKARGDLQNRNVGVVYVVGQNVSAELGPEPAAIPVKLRSHFRAARDAFRVVLTSRDGKAHLLLSDAPLTAKQLFHAIDAATAPNEEAPTRD